MIKFALYIVVKPIGDIYIDLYIDEIYIDYIRNVHLLPLSKLSEYSINTNCFQTLYVSQFRKKLTDPSRRLWMTVQPPGSCLWSHQTCISLLMFSGFTRYMPLCVWPSSRACRQSLNGPVCKHMHYKNRHIQFSHCCFYGDL